MVPASGAPDCSILTVLVIPPPVKITAALRPVVEELAATVTVTVESPVPLAGSSWIQEST